MHQNVPISLLETPFDHLYFHPTSGLDPDLILTVFHKQILRRLKNKSGKYTNLLFQSGWGKWETKIYQYIFCTLLEGIGMKQCCRNWGEVVPSWQVWKLCWEKEGGCCWRNYSQASTTFRHRHGWTFFWFRRISRIVEMDIWHYWHYWLLRWTSDTKRFSEEYSHQFFWYLKLRLP